MRDATRTGALRVLGLAIQALARRFLSGRPAAGEMVRALRGAVRHGRDQQQLLSFARTRHLRVVGAAGAAVVRVRRKGEPLPDAHEEAEGPGRADRSPLL